MPQFSSTRAVPREPLHATVEERINQALHYTEDDIMMRKWERAYEELTYIKFYVCVVTYCMCISARI